MPPHASPPVSLRKDGTLKGHRSRVFDLRWSPTQPARIASVGEAGGYIWSVGGKDKAVAFAGTELMRVCWHPDGEHLLTGSALGKIVVHAADGQATATLDASAEDEVYGLEVLSSEGLLAAGAGDTVQLWDLHRAMRMTQVRLAPMDGGFKFGGAHRNPDGTAYLFGLAARGRVLSAALSDGTVRLLDSETLETLQVLGDHARRGAPAFATAISPTSPLLASSDGQGAVLLYDLRQMGNGPLSETHSSSGAVHSLAFVPGAGGSELLVTGGADCAVRVHETRVALQLQSMVHMLSPVLCIAAAPDYAATTDTIATGNASHRGVPQFATGGGSGELISDASVTLWRLGESDEPHSSATEATSSAGQGRAGVKEKRQRLGAALEAGLEEGGGLEEPRECVLCENTDN